MSGIKRTRLRSVKCAEKLEPKSSRYRRYQQSYSRDGVVVLANAQGPLKLVQAV